MQHRVISDLIADVQEFKDICSLCLVKDVSCRPTVKELLAHPFMQVNSTYQPVVDMKALKYSNFFFTECA